MLHKKTPTKVKTSSLTPHPQHHSHQGLPLFEAFKDWHTLCNSFTKDSNLGNCSRATSKRCKRLSSFFSVRFIFWLLSCRPCFSKDKALISSRTWGWSHNSLNLWWPSFFLAKAAHSWQTLPFWYSSRVHPQIQHSLAFWVRPPKFVRELELGLSSFSGVLWLEDAASLGSDLSGVLNADVFFARLLPLSFEMWSSFFSCFLSTVSAWERLALLGTIWEESATGDGGGRACKGCSGPVLFSTSPSASKVGSSMTWSGLEHDGTTHKKIAEQMLNNTRKKRCNTENKLTRDILRPSRAPLAFPQQRLVLNFALLSALGVVQWNLCQLSLRNPSILPLWALQFQAYLHAYELPECYKPLSHPAQWMPLSICKTNS